MPDYKTWTIPKIQQELKKRGAKRISGRKAELIERLEAYDRNNNFAGPSASLPTEEQMPEFPDISNFRSITEQMQDLVPPIRKEHVQQYVLFRQGHDSEANENVSAMTNEEEMEDSVQALSMFKSPAEIAPVCFFIGLVNASMKKNTAYNLKFVVGAETGEIKTSNCECPAGIGPHGTCKHIVSSLLLLSDFKRSGVLKVLKSCTETLQTFHKPRQYHKGSPKKAADFKGIRPVDDPRPSHLRNLPGYNDFVNNQAINFVYQSKLDIGLRYRGLPADLQTAANHDHNYLQKPFVQY